MLTFIRIMSVWVTAGARSGWLEFREYGELLWRRVFPLMLIGAV